MSCFHPRRIYFTGRVNSETGGREIIFGNYNQEFLSLDQARKKYPDLKVNETMRLINGTWFLTHSLPVPCGRCECCKFSKAKQWALRCMVESRKYDYNYFLTLTYSDDNYIDDLEEVKRDFQGFMKRLRAFYNQVDIRFFACGERGSRTLRCHAHSIIFNLNIKDLVRYDNDYQTSETIDKLWRKGNVLIGPVTSGSCSYVARYTAKKKHKQLGEWLLMSRRPGIGYDYFKQNEDMLADEKMYFYDGNKSTHSIPRYYRYLHNKEDDITARYLAEHHISDVEEKQLMQANMNGFDDLEDYFEHQGEVFNRRDKNNRSKI